MKKLIFAVLTVFSCSVIAQDKKVEPDTNRIFWEKGMQIEWKDFQGKANTDAKVAALSSIGLPYRFTTDGEGSMEVFVEVCFIKDESWSIDELENNLLLKHERLHFDIAELHRRKIIKEIMNTKFNKKNYREKLDEIIEKYWIEAYRDVQDLYDKETNFSRVVKSQIKWNEKITKALKAHSEYTDSKISVNLIHFD